MEAEVAMGVRGKRAWVTGANRGIGLAIAQGLAEAGAEVLLLGRDGPGLAAATAAIEASGGSALAAVVDLAEPAAIEALFEAHPLGPEILINNAGLIDEPGPSWAQGLATWEAVMAVNLRAPFWLCHHALPRMRARGFGRVVNLSSGMGSFEGGGEPGHVAYRVSKAGLNMLTQTLAAEAGPGVLVNAMCPGWVRTRMGGEGAPRDVGQGADTALWLAGLPPEGPTGGFFRDRQAIAW